MIDFKAIRTHHGDKRSGFEELTSQLFFSEEGCDETYRRIEGSGGDGGVEAYWRPEANGESGFQAKYFDSLGASQWKQLTKSVTAAIKSHPDLQKYVIAAPLDLTPAQEKKWNEQRVLWNSLAKECGVSHTIEFVWWGESRLIEILTKEEHRGKVWYWFDLPAFSLEWLKSVNKSSISQLDKRYSPREHVEVGTSRRLQSFAWSAQVKGRIVDSLSSFMEAWSRLDGKLTKHELDEDGVSEKGGGFRDACGKITSFRWPETQGMPVIWDFLEDVRAAIESRSSFEISLRSLHQKHCEREQEKKEKGDSSRGTHFDFLLSDLSNFREPLIKLRTTLEEAISADYNRLFLFGEAGTGKSHLLADIVDAAMIEGQVSLMLLGERFSSEVEPWTQVAQLIGWEHGVESLLHALHEAAQLSGRPALICIDAVNETENRRYWKSHLVDFSNRLDAFPWVSLVISCRSDYRQDTLPQILLDQGKEGHWPSFTHRGYGEEVIEAIENYFSAHQIEATQFPPMIQEFRNPLFLRIFCEAFEGQAFPQGVISLEMVMEKRVQNLCRQLEDEIGCDHADTREALSLVAQVVAAGGSDAVPREMLRREINKLHPVTTGTRSLYQRIVSNGMLVESLKWQGADKPSLEMVRFPFERFSDYFRAKYLLDGVKGSEELKAAFSENETLRGLKLGYYRDRGLGRALAILIPEKYQIEMPDILESEVLDLILEDFLDSFAWRSAPSFSESTRVWLDRCGELEVGVLDTLLRVSTILDHPYNATHLVSWLKNFELPDLETKWTILISEGGADYIESTTIDDILGWCLRAPLHLIPDSQAGLTGRMLICLCSSNWQSLRRRATSAAIRILEGRPGVVAGIVRDLSSISDPYILERLYAVAAGVAMRPAPLEQLEELAVTVHEVIFAKEFVTPNIMIRDFAQAALESCRVKGALPVGILPASFTAPFRSKFPSIQSSEEADRFEDNDAWNWIYFSIAPESMGSYGDFGRYVMGYAVHQFSDKKLTEDPPTKRWGEVFDDQVARRWILQRIVELGWNSETFGDYEGNLPNRGRQRVDIEADRIERISKKYQWIGLRELQGYLSDHYHLALDYGEVPEVFEGAWQLYARNFDPSAPLPRAVEKDHPEFSAAESYRGALLSPHLRTDRDAWVRKEPPEFAPLISPVELGSDAMKSPDWIVLSGHYKFAESEYEAAEVGGEGKLSMWVDIRSYLVLREDVSSFRDAVSQLNFWGKGCDLPTIHSGWIGEYPWGRSYDSLREWTGRCDEWMRDLSIPHIITSAALTGNQGRVLSPQMFDLMKLRWTGRGTKFETHTGELATSQLEQEDSWANPIIVKRELLRKALSKSPYELVWCALSEKRCWCSHASKSIVPRQLESNAVFQFDQTKNEVEGEFTQVVVHDFPVR